MTPGKTVLRRMRSCPSRIWSRTRSIARSNERTPGSMNSSTGVPIVTTTVSASPMTSDDVVDPQAAGGQNTGQDLIGATFQERHSSGRDQAHPGVVDIEQGHLGPCLGQGDSQGQADVPAPADDAHRVFHPKKSLS